MSHFSTVRAGITDKNALVEGLKALLAKHNLSIPVEVYDTPQELINNYSEDENRMAEVILRAEDLKAYTDIGFVRQGNEYVAEIDEFDFRCSCLKGEFHTVSEFLQLVQQAHTEAYIKANYPASEWVYSSEELEGGKSVITLTKKEEQEVWL